ncbi:MAG TPA: hypothetical protein VN106_10565 [Sphingomicrobium sp.]|nr:hypothetical protein [Sphingomicrobium sp.]
MRNARFIVAVGIAALALGACHKQQQQAQDQNISIDEGVPDNQMAVGNADIETLPPDESSTTPSNQLQNGFDNPDVNDVGPSGNSD